MTKQPTPKQFEDIAQGYDEKASASLSLRAEAYTDAMWYNIDLKEIITKTWQWVCHVEKLREPGS